MKVIQVVLAEGVGGLRALLQVRRADAGRHLRGPAGGAALRLLHGAQGSVVPARLPAPVAADAEPAERGPLAREGVPDRTTRRPEHRYIRTTVYDNRAVLGEEYIADLEAAYPPGTVLRRRFIEGLRGLSVVGEPVYGGYFQRALHVGEDLQMNPEAPLLRGLGLRPQPSLRGLGAVPPAGRPARPRRRHGRGDVHRGLRPIALQYRSQWFPHPLEVLSTGDPAGESFSPHGVSKSAVDVLRANGVRCRPPTAPIAWTGGTSPSRPWRATCAVCQAAERPSASIRASSS